MKVLSIFVGFCRHSRACGSAVAGRSTLAAVHAALSLPLPLLPLLPLLTDDCERPNEVDATTAAQLRQLPVRPLSAAEVCRKAEMTVVAVCAARVSDESTRIGETH
jgi:hypothetical protein